MVKNRSYVSRVIGWHGTKNKRGPDGASNERWSLVELVQLYLSRGREGKPPHPSPPGNLRDSFLFAVGSSFQSCYQPDLCEAH